MKYILPILTAIAGIVIAVIFMKSCRPTLPPIIKHDTSYNTITDTVRDSVLVPYRVEVAGKPIQITKYDTTIKRDTIRLTGADSIRIAGDYFVLRSYRDTLRHLYGYVVIDNSVTQNKLSAQSAIFNFKVPEITNTVTEQKRLGYLGFNGGVGNGIGMGGIDLLYIDKKDRLFRVQIDYTTLGSPFFQAGLATKIKLF